jgi:O-succinylbenzoic acid--CoA ligase
VKLPVWIRARAAQTPDSLALRAGRLELSFAELERSAENSARALRALGVRDGEPVAALLGNAPEFVSVVHGAALCGAALVPLNARLTGPELAYQLADARPRVLVHGSGELAALARAAAAGLPELTLAEVPLRATDDSSELRAELASEDTAAIVYTSGTTGAPKGAELSHGAFLWSALAASLHLGHAPAERWLACMPLFHVGGLSILYRSALTGASVVLHERFDPVRANESLDRDGITLVSFVAAMLERVLDARGARPAPPGLRCVLLGGGPAPRPLLERARALGFPIATTYGLTEAASQVATAAPADLLTTRDGVGGPLFGTELRILSPDGVGLPPGEAGEIAVRGPTLMKGYLRRPEDSARALRGGWLHTGDVGLVDARGELVVLDRRSDLIVTGGENVYPAEVEAALLSHPAIAEAGVAPEPAPQLGQRVAAWIVLRPGAQAQSSELDTFCRERLAGYKTPRAYYFVASLPRSASGKLLRRALRDSPTRAQP